MRTVEELLAELRKLAQKAAGGHDISAGRARVERELQEKGIRIQDGPKSVETVEAEALARALARRGLAGQRSGSRFAGGSADPEVLRHIAAGGSVTPGVLPGGSVVGTALSPGGIGADDGGKAMAEFLRTMTKAKRGDASAQAEMERKGWTATADSTGGFFIPPDIEAGYLAKRNATAPLRALCRPHETTSDEVRRIIENGTVTVAMVPEGATKPNSTGSIAQKVSGIYKAAGSSTVTWEDLNDTEGQVGALIEQQFATQVALTIDVKMLTGTGSGEPTGLLNAAGVPSTAMVGEGDATRIRRYVARAASKLTQRYYAPLEVAIVMHPRVALEFDLALTTTGELMFPGGVADALRTFGTVVLDSNMPTNLGTGTNESPIALGAFFEGMEFYSREAFNIKTSEHAEFYSNEVAYIGEERWGSAVVKPTAFELITGVKQSEVALAEEEEA